MDLDDKNIMKNITKQKTFDEMIELIKKFPIKPMIRVQNQGEWIPGSLLPLLEKHEK